MKPLNLLAALGLCAFLEGAVPARAQVLVGVDGAQKWQGYMNVYDVGGSSPLWGSGWGTADLQASVSGGVLTLSPNVNCWNASDSYWVVNGAANKKMEANYYVDTPALGGQTVVFSGTVLANTLAAGYSAQAVIKEFGPGYSWIGMTTVPLVGGTDFSVSRNIGAGDIVQYGFMTTGLVADPATVAALGSASIQVVPEPSSLALLGLAALGTLCARRK